MEKFKGEVAAYKESILILLAAIQVVSLPEESLVDGTAAFCS